MLSMKQFVLREMSTDKLKAYRVRAKQDSISKVNTDRSKSIKRAQGAEKAQLKILAKEDAVPANCAGAGNVDGIGVGPKGEPGVKRKKPVLLGSIIKRKVT